MISFTKRFLRIYIQDLGHIKQRDKGDDMRGKHSISFFSEDSLVNENCHMRAVMFPSVLWPLRSCPCSSE